MLRRRTADVLPFRRYEQHSASIIFITMIVALLLAAGAALDYARVAKMREGIEAAVTSASAAGTVAMRDATLRDVEIEAIVVSHFDKDVAFARHVGTIDPPLIHIDHAAPSVSVETKGTVAMTISRLFGVNEISVPATSSTDRTPQDADAR